MKPAIYLAFSDDGEHIRFWTQNSVIASQWEHENWGIEPFYSHEQMMAEMPEGCTPADARVLREANHGLAAENDRLRAAIQQTLDENGHLADGEVCTLILLKRAIEVPNACGEPGLAEQGKY